MGRSEKGNILLLQFPVVPLPASRDIIAEHLQAAAAATGPDPCCACSQSLTMHQYQGFPDFSFEERAEIEESKGEPDLLPWSNWQHCLEVKAGNWAAFVVQKVKSQFFWQHHLRILTCSDFPALTASELWPSRSPHQLVCTTGTWICWILSASCSGLAKHSLLLSGRAGSCIPEGFWPLLPFSTHFIQENPTLPTLHSLSAMEAAARCCQSPSRLESFPSITFTMQIPVVFTGTQARGKRRGESILHLQKSCMKPMLQFLSFSLLRLCLL